jgi:hypothetical protein
MLKQNKLSITKNMILSLTLSVLILSPAVLSDWVKKFYSFNINCPTLCGSLGHLMVGLV